MMITIRFEVEKIPLDSRVSIDDLRHWYPDFIWIEDQVTVYAIHDFEFDLDLDLDSYLDLFEGSSLLLIQNICNMIRHLERNDELRIIDVDLYPTSEYITQSEMSSVLEVSRSAISQYINGERRTSVPFPNPVLNNVWLRADVVQWYEKTNQTNEDESIGDEFYQLGKLIHALNMHIKSRNADKNVLKEYIDDAFKEHVDEMKFLD